MDDFCLHPGFKVIKTWCPELPAYFVHYVAAVRCKRDSKENVIWTCLHKHPSTVLAMYCAKAALCLIESHLEGWLRSPRTAHGGRVDPYPPQP